MIPGTIADIANSVIAAGLPLLTVRQSGTDITVVLDPTTTPAQQQQANAIAAQHDVRPRKPRMIAHVITGGDGLPGLTGLTPTQQVNLWNDFSSNQRWLVDPGANAVQLLALGRMVQDELIPATATHTRGLALALYIQDNPRYAETPAFDPSINVPGDMLV